MTTYPHIVNTQLRPRTTHSLDRNPPPLHPSQQPPPPTTPHSRCATRSINKSTLTETETGSALNLRNREEISARTWQSGRLFLTNAQETGRRRRWHLEDRVKRSDERLTARRESAEITTKYLPLTECKGGLEGREGRGGIANTWSLIGPGAVTTCDVTWCELSHDVRNSCRPFCSDPLNNVQ